ncbi:MAG: hypothetical protein WDZ30_06525 [Cellvibrionaceae bacterium]
MGLLVLAGLFLALGTGLLAWALYRYLLTLTTPALAAAILGSLMVLLGGGLLWLSNQRSR